MSHTLNMGGVMTYKNIIVTKAKIYDPNLTTHSARSETPQGLVMTRLIEELPTRHRVFWSEA